MAVIVHTLDPAGLLAKLRRKIEEENVRTWTADEEGDFTLVAEEWHRHAWLRPRTHPEHVTFRIFPARGSSISRKMYGVFHARFIEMLLCCFDDDIESARATAMPAYGDVVRSAEA